MKYIEELKDGDRLFDIYLCKYKQSAITKNGKSYENVILQDKTGTIDAKIWDPNSSGIEEFDILDYVEVFGEVTSFQGALQVNVKRVRLAREGEYEAKNYVPVSSKDINEMYEELLKLLKEVKNPHLTALINSFFVEDPDFIKAFQYSSAAKSVHHGFVGGLLEHTLSVLKLCDYYTKAYPLLNKDLLFTAAVFHDIGKTKIPIEILNKKARLSDEEFEIIRKHALYGYEMIKSTGCIPNDVCKAVLLHHEHEDKSGYPFGFGGGQLGLYEKILAVADVYDAMTSDRVYKKRATPFEVFEMFKTVGIGIFDIDVLNVFLKNISTYYTGMKVLLSNGETGEIAYVPPHDITNPIVVVNANYIDPAQQNIKIISML
jgi:putative nucleotidyltransferase with HDIG domain